MTTLGGSSNFRKPWAWLTALVVLGLVLAASIALYQTNPGVKLPLPWWASVVAPALFYALVLPACVPRMGIAGWLAGFLALAVLHVGIGLAMAGLYVMAGVTPFEEAFEMALWGFPPALVLSMIGSLGMAYPFLRALAQPATDPRLRTATEPPWADAMTTPDPAPPEDHVAPALDQGSDRRAWARSRAGAGQLAPAATAVAPAVSVPRAAARRPIPAPEEPPVPAATQGSITSVTSDTATASAPASEPPAVEPAAETPAARRDDTLVAALPDFRQALSELFSTPVTGEGPAEASAPPEQMAPEQVAPEQVVQISFNRVMGQLPPGAFRVPLSQVGARLRTAGMLVVDMAVIMPQLGEGVVQVEWERVAEQFPRDVFAVTPAEMRERIVNGRLLLPLDEIVRQVPPEVFAASLGGGPVAVPGIESFPAPFTPLEWTEPSLAPSAAQAVGLTAPPPPAPAQTVSEPEAAPVSAPEPVAVEPPVVPESEVAAHGLRVGAEKIAALLAPWDTSALDEDRVGDLAVLSVSGPGLTRDAVVAAAGRLSPILARRARRPVEQATLRGVGGTLVLTPAGSGWSTGTALAVGVRQGGALARVEMLARDAAARHDSTTVAAQPRDPTPAVRLDAAKPPARVVAAAANLEAFGPLTARSYREPTSGTLIHCLVSPRASAEELAPFAWEVAQAMAQESHAGTLGSFHSAVLRSGRERVEIRRLPSAGGPAPLLVVAGADSGRPGLARLQVERAAARLCGA